MSVSDTQLQLQNLSLRLDRLMDLTRRLGEENLRLRQSQDQLISERAHLLGKNDLARSRVEAMIARLKSLEQNA